MAQQWQGKTKGNLLGYKIFVYLLNFFGLGVAYFLLIWVSLYYVLFSFKTTKNLFNFYKKALHFSRIKALLYVWKNYYYLGQALIDKVAIYSGKKNWFNIIKENYKLFQEKAAEDKPLVLIMSHLGNYSIAGSLVKINKPVNLLMFEAEIEEIKNFITGLKTNHEVANVIPYDGEHIFKIFEVMKRNEVLCLHGDRFVQGVKTIKTSFFGKEASFPYGPFYIASKFKATTFLLNMMKTGKKEYTLVPILLDATKGKNALVEEYAKKLEQEIKKHPESWFNYHNFWA